MREHRRGVRLIGLENDIALILPIRWEDLTWEPGMILIPRGKTKRSRRHVPMSQRVIEALQIRRNGQTQGWVFPSDSACGHTTSVAKAFAKVREDFGLSKEIVLYCARHTFATKVMHPSLETVRSVINGNQGVTSARHNSRHTAANGPTLNGVSD